MAASTMSMKLGSSSATVRGSTTAGHPFQKAAPRTIRSRFVVTAASKDQNADNKGHMPKIAAGVLAATLAVMPFSGPAQAGFLGEVKDEVTSASARADANQKTSNLPSLKDVGASLGSNFGSSDTGKLPNTGDAKNIANKISNAAPDLPSPGQVNLPDASDLKGAASKLKDKVSFNVDLPSANEVKGKIQANTPSLPSAGEVANKVDANTPDLPSAGGVSGFFQNITDKLTGSGSDATSALKNAGSDVKNQVGANTSAVPTSSELKGDADKLANKVGGELPGPGATGNIFADMQNKLPNASDLKGAAADLKNKVSFNIDLPSANEVKGKVQANTPSLPSAGEVANKVDANTPDLPSAGGVSGFFQNITDKLTGSGNDATDALKNAGSDVKNQVGANTPAVPTSSELKGDADKLANKVGGELPGPGTTGNIFADMQNKVPDASDLKGAAADLKDKVSFNVDLPSAGELKGKVDANTPNLPSLPSAGEVANKVDANTPNLPSLGGNIFQQLGDKLSNNTPDLGDVKAQVGKATSNLPSPSDLGDKLANVPNVPTIKDFPSVNQLTDKVQGAFPGVPDTNDVKGLASSLATKPI